MEFKSLNNIETSFRQIRLFALVFICLCALVTGFAVWNSYSFAEKQRQKIYVLDNGKEPDARTLAGYGAEQTSGSQIARAAFPRTVFHLIARQGGYRK